MLYANATAKTLGMLRFWVFGCAAVSRVFRPAWEAYYIPDYFSVGIMRLTGAQSWVPALSLQGAIAIQVLTIGLLVAVALGIG